MVLTLLAVAASILIQPKELSKIRPVPDGFFSALCEIVPAYVDPGTRYTGYCQVSLKPDTVTIQYSGYLGAMVPPTPFEQFVPGVEESEQYEFVPGLFPFKMIRIAGWGLTVIYPVSLDKQAEFMQHSCPRKRVVPAHVSWQEIPGGFELRMVRILNPISGKKASEKPIPPCPGCAAPG